MQTQGYEIKLDRQEKHEMIKTIDLTHKQLTANQINTHFKGLKFKLTPYCANCNKMKGFIAEFCKKL